MKIPPGDIFSISSFLQFENLALRVFRSQATQNPVYSEYLRILGCNPLAIRQTKDIPFLPISFFRTHRVFTGKGHPAVEFTSSGTTGSDPGRHFVKDPDLYRESFTRCFSIFYGNPARYRILALLPSYLERKGSSLVYMVNELIHQSGHTDSGFFLHNLDKLAEILEKPRGQTLLIGVSFALAELAEKYPLPLKNTLVMETGGMKGRREEITRQELHGILIKAFGLKNIHSEYGMTELLSQAYAEREGLFFCPPWMRVTIRDRYDPFSPAEPGQTGGINVIDLANRHSCSFIETEDLGRLHSQGGFEVLGRFDQSAIRGCNLMYGEGETHN